MHLLRKHLLSRNLFPTLHIRVHSKILHTRRMLLGGRERSKREAALAGASIPATAEGEERGDENQMDVDKPSASETKPTLSVVEEEDIPTYTSIEAPPSILPQKRYCDITGLEAPYTDPATGLRYHDKSIYEFIKTLNASTVKEYLALRGVNPIVK
ncbi:IES6 [Sanghuangporus sanghuang]